VRIGRPDVAPRGYRGRSGEHDRNEGKAAGAVTTTVLTSVVISVAITLALLLLVLLGRGRPRVSSQEDAVDRVVADLTSRMEAMGRELNEALELAREESRRTRVLGELASTIDLDEVLSRTLGTAAALPNVDAALLSVRGAGDEPLTTALGITAEEAEQYSLGEVPSGRRIRTLVLGFGNETEQAGQRAAPRAGVAVPISGEEEPLGLLTVFSRTSNRPFDEQLLEDVEALALRAGRAIDNARRFREARRQADVEPLTGLHSRRYFFDTLAREIARAQRYDRRLALVLFDLDDFKAINTRGGLPAGDAVLREIAARVREVVRHTDIACRLGGDEFAIVLPESALEDARQLYARIGSAIESRPIPHANGVRLSAGIAAVRSEDDGESFYARAADALRRAKEGGKGQVEPE
jgi:diguanylate cyclase (GGDEF)-like protein